MMTPPAGVGSYSMITPSAGCQNLTAVNLTAAQQSAAPRRPAPCASRTAPRSTMYSPEMTRIGANSRFDGEHERPHPGLCMFNFAETKTSARVRAASPTDGFGTTD
jgi:hypothetical protein